MSYFQEGPRPSQRSDGSQEYVTTNVDLGAFIAASGVDPVRIEPPPPDSFPKHASLVFPLTSAVEDAVSIWESGRTTEISPKDYSAQRHRLYRICRDMADFSGGGR